MAAYLRKIPGLKRLVKEEIKPEQKVEKKVEPSWVEKACNEASLKEGQTREELYKLASEIFFLYPEKIGVSREEAIKLANTYKDAFKQKLNLHIALAMSIYEGNKKNTIEDIKAYAKSVGDEQFGKKLLEYVDQLLWVQKHGYKQAV